MTTLADRVQARRQCPETYHGVRCTRLEHPLEQMCEAGDERWRLPAWLARARSNGGLPALDLTGKSTL